MTGPDDRLREASAEASTGAQDDPGIGPDPATPVRTRFRTLSGSIYEIERDEVGGMRWRRLEATLRSGRLRQADGWPLLVWPDIALGRPALLIGPPLVAPVGVRVVETSPVVEVLDG